MNQGNVRACERCAQKVSASKWRHASQRTYAEIGESYSACSPDGTQRAPAALAMSPMWTVLVLLVGVGGPCQSPCLCGAGLRLACSSVHETLSV